MHVVVNLFHVSCRLCVCVWSATSTDDVTSLVLQSRTEIDEVKQAMDEENERLLRESRQQRDNDDATDDDSVSNTRVYCLMLMCTV